MRITALILLGVLATGDSARFTKDLLQGGKDLLQGGQDVVATAAEKSKDLAGGAVSVTKDVANATKEVATDAVDTVKEVAEDAVNTVMSFPGKAADLVRPEDVCYGDLGCFSMDSPWFSFTRPLPAPNAPDFIQARFYLYTAKQRGRFNLSKTDTEFNAKGSDFIGSRQTYFITHGFASNGNSSWLSDMKDAILTHHDANVILVDWGKGASLLNYFQVASNTRVVGATLVKLGNYLINQWGADPSRFNVIGHSLGAQISSYMCKGIPGVARLYALDPAQPAFEGYDKEVRLDKTDANFVQVIHTSSRLFIPLLGLGMIQEHGHVDFYMNGGWNQPGCILPPKPNITSFVDLATVPVEVISNFIGCPHGRSYEFLTSSILHAGNCTFWGHRARPHELIASIISAGHLAKAVVAHKECEAVEDCTPLGIQAVDYPGRGSFAVATNSNNPFCISEPTSDKSMRKFRSLSKSSGSQ